MTGSRAIACILVLLPLAWGCGGNGAGEEEAEAPEVVEPEEAGETSIPDESASGSLTPLSFRRVTVYFPSAYGNRLVGEPHEIFETASPGDRAKQILSDVLAGPNDPDSLLAVPQGIRLRQVYVLDSGVAYADFSSELARRIGGGSMDEILTVYAIVNSLVLNVEEIDRVGILLDGRPCETLNGHVDLRRPLPANLRLLRQRDDADGSII